MPPKRKAVALPTADDSPPLKRRLRSAKTTPLVQPAPPARVTRRGRGQLQAGSQSAQAVRYATRSKSTGAPVEIPITSVPIKTARHRGRPKASATGTAPAPKVARRSGRSQVVAPTDGQLEVSPVDKIVPKRLPTRRRPNGLPYTTNDPTSAIVEASSSQIQLDNIVGSTSTADARVVDSEDEPDELLSSSSKKQTPRLVTPPPSAPHMIGTPRMFLHSVEIATPSRRFLRDAIRTGSPTPRRGTSIIPMPASPMLTAPKKPILHLQSPSKTRDTRSLRTPSPAVPLLASQSMAVPTSPSKVRYPVSSKKAAASPSKRHVGPVTPNVSPSHPTRNLPSHLHSCLEAQRRAVLRSLQNIPEVKASEVGDDEAPTNAVAYEQLCDLLKGTVLRGEGNSCLLIGPRASGKTHVVQRAIASLPEKPIVIRLSGYVQHNDRLALREIAWQLAQQTGNSLLPSGADDDVEGALADPENPFVDEAPDSAITVPPPSHLLALISMIPMLPRPTVVVLDGFDLFATHARQSLLYCLLDTAQSCRVGKATKGIAVIGVTTRVDTINLLEKRVKSRFSGRMLRTACPGQLQHWTDIARAVLSSSIGTDEQEEWGPLWGKAVDQFLADDTVSEVLKETFALSRDVQMLRRILTNAVIDLTPTYPYLSSANVATCVSIQRCPPRCHFLRTLSYPAICLLIASVHTQTSGHDSFTYEMLHESFRNQVRTSQSAPVQIEGGGIGMVRCSREVLLGAFERLIALRIFTPVSAPSSSTAREFTSYRCVVDRMEVKAAVETMGQTNLKKWFSKAQ
ncbi:Origin recognition complex subunit 4 [Grifola frondosa]|uniref:Origin recognition complex subunit 4 n=1 Tax=Grifola frondosa TaxID=5627 RepID=A0A1C7M1W1_GRIFR|nr:Origin recognition complex subunit 4 [Grifola frondosa]